MFGQVSKRFLFMTDPHLVLICHMAIFWWFPNELRATLGTLPLPPVLRSCPIRRGYTDSTFCPNLMYTELRISDFLVPAPPLHRDGLYSFVRGSRATNRVFSTHGENPASHSQTPPGLWYVRAAS
jgi:hypothetical protein